MDSSISTGVFDSRIALFVLTVAFCGLCREDIPEGSTNHLFAAKSESSLPGLVNGINPIIAIRHTNRSG